MDTKDYMELVVAVLEDNLPPFLAEKGLPSMLEYGYGTQILNPTQKLPRLYVDSTTWTQEEVQLDRKKERVLNLTITAGVEGPNPVTVASQIHELSDAITLALEMYEPAGGNVWWQVVSTDFSPPIQRSHALAHFMVTELELHYDRAHAGGSGSDESYLIHYGGVWLQRGGVYLTYQGL